MNDVRLKSRSLPRTVVLYLITGGLYGIYLIINLGFAVSRESGGRRSWALTACLLTFALLIFAFAIVAPISAAIGEGELFQRVFSSGIAFLVALVLAICTYTFAAVLASWIARFLRQKQASSGLKAHCSSSRAAWLTVLGFIGAIYLQHHVNSLSRSG